MEDIYRQLQENKEEHLKIMEKIDEFGKTLEEVRISIAQMPDKIFERADKKYASKLAEKIVYGLIGIIVSGVILALLALVIQ